MRYPRLKEMDTDRQMVDVFKGYNHNLRIGSGEFFDMKNMTSDYYPVLSPRGIRGKGHNGSSIQGMIAKDGLFFVDGDSFVMNGTKIPMGLSTKAEDCPKRMVSMGAYVIIMPDKKYVNTADINDYGSIEESHSTQDDVKFSLLDTEGREFHFVIVKDSEPDSTDTWELWYDASTWPYTPKIYNEQSHSWVAIMETHVKISATGIGVGLNKGDTVTISGIVEPKVEALNGNLLILDCSDDYITVKGTINNDAWVTQKADSGSVSVERRMPNMDFIIESENRLWGCRYGIATNGKMVNEIYASKLGDFKNWNSFDGISMDSYVASCGTDGPFTGAINHMGYPLFFKENCVHKVFGHYPANYQVQTTMCRGVQKNSHNSLAIVNETLFYKSIGGIMAFDGSLPVEVSYALGGQEYYTAAAGAAGNKYYISMMDVYQCWHLFVYDVAKGLWHKEDDYHAVQFCQYKGILYGLGDDRTMITVMFNPVTVDAKPVDWMVETGELGISSPDMKYVSRVTLRMEMALGSQAQIFAQYDMSGYWEPVCNLTGNSLRRFSIPIRPRRCDHFKLRIEGIGDVKIYSFAKTIERGSELS